MSFDDNNFDDAGDAPLPEESNNNRTFLIAAGILGGIILISIACLVGVYLFGLQNKNTAAAINTTATIDAANTFIAEALTATATAAILPTTTLTPVPPSAVVSVATVTNTPNPALTAAAAGAGTPAAATATVGAALTQAAIAQLTVFPTTTALSKGGIADEYGLPGLVVMALAFVIVILLARRLRVSPTMNR